MVEEKFNTLYISYIGLRHIHAIVLFYCMKTGMLDIQLGRRNLPPAQRISVIDKFKKKIQEQAENKKEESNQSFYGNRYTGKLESSPNGEQSKKLHTDKELAKMAGVGKETYRMGAKVLNSNNEDVKQRVLSSKTSRIIFTETDTFQR